LTNLLSNAIKFSPAGGGVALSATPTERHVRIAVRDHGPGIPDVFRDRIFQKFAQANATNTRTRGGTGLGLSITKAIVELHGGHIGFTTEMGVGTTFFVDLPLWQADDDGAVEDRAHHTSDVDQRC
jgi:signal transduction histidine kinase